MWWFFETSRPDEEKEKNVKSQKIKWNENYILIRFVKWTFKNGRCTNVQTYFL